MGTTTGEVLISYDIDKSHKNVKDDLIALNYYDNFKFQNKTKTYYLPETTLWHENKSSDQAMIDLKKVCANLGVTIQKAISVKATEFVGY